MGLGIPSRPAPLRPTGRPEGPRSAALKLRAKALQSTPPQPGFDAHLMAFHPAKDEPDMQRHDTGDGHELPLGEPMLMWSFHRGGEGDPALEAHRATAFDMDPAEVRRRRQELLERAAPQRGADALEHHHTGTTPIHGAEDLGPSTSSADGPAGSAPGTADQEDQS